jgi:sulfate adenylyltransferase subunit 2
MLYSIGKDSSVMLHLATKPFFPSKPPFPLLHVDTTRKFREMYEFRDTGVRELGVELIVHVNPEAVQRGINPFVHGSAVHTDIWKTQGLRQALDQGGHAEIAGHMWAGGFSKGDCVRSVTVVVLTAVGSKLLLQR